MGVVEFTVDKKCIKLSCPVQAWQENIKVRLLGTGDAKKETINYDRMYFINLTAIKK